MIADDSLNILRITKARFNKFDFAQTVFQFEIDHVFFGITLSTEKVNNQYDIWIFFMAHVQKDEFLVECIDQIEFLASFIRTEFKRARVIVWKKFTVVGMTVSHVICVILLNTGPIAAV